MQQAQTWSLVSCGVMVFCFFTSFLLLLYSSIFLMKRWRSSLQISFIYMSNISGVILYKKLKKKLVAHWQINEYSWMIQFLTSFGISASICTTNVNLIFVVIRVIYASDNSNQNLSNQFCTCRHCLNEWMNSHENIGRHDNVCLLLFPTVECLLVNDSHRTSLVHNNMPGIFSEIPLKTCKPSCISDCDYPSSIANQSRNSCIISNCNCRGSLYSSLNILQHRSRQITKIIVACNLDSLKDPCRMLYS
jgi:hypothetical protein